MTSGKEDFVNAKIVAQHLGVARSFVYQLVAEKKIPYYKVSQRFLFKISEIDGCLERDMRYA